MRRGLSRLLHALARRLYNDSHSDWVEVIDEHGISRWRVEFASDDAHGICAEFVALPDGWLFKTYGNEKSQIWLPPQKT